MPSYLTSKEIKMTASYKGVSQSASTSIEAKGYDIPAILGVGTNLSLGQGYALMLSATYVRGLISISKEKSNVYSEGFVLATGLSIPL